MAKRTYIYSGGQWVDITTGAGIPRYSAAPTSPAPTANQTYYNTTDGNTYIYNGSTWDKVVANASTSASGVVQLEDTPSATTSKAATSNAVYGVKTTADGAIQKTTLSNTGDVMYASSANTPARLGVGSANTVLSMNNAGTLPAYQSLSTLHGAVATVPSQATGDILYASSATALARLGVGSAGQVLEMNSTATAPTWANPPMTLIATVTAAGTANTVSITNIPQTYTHIFIQYTDVRCSTAADSCYMRFNSNSGSSYWDIGGNVTAGAGGSTSAAATSFGTAGGANTYEPIAGANSTSVASQYARGQVWIYRYAAAGSNAVFTSWQSAANATTAAKMLIGQGYFLPGGASAVSSVQFLSKSAGTSFITGTFYVYGI